MSRLKAIWSGVFGLFVDDGPFAAAILVWLGACGLGLPRLPPSSAWPGPILFGGLALILAASALRAAARRR